MADDDQHVLEMVRLASLATPWAIRAAVTFALPDLIDAGHSSVEELARHTGTDADALGRVLRYLTGLGVFAQSGDGTYQVTPFGRVLRHDHGSGIHSWLDQSGFSGRIDQTYGRLIDSVRSGKPAYEPLFGLPAWDDLENQPELADSFNRMMASHTDVFAAAVATEYDWSAVRRVVDVGGGLGHLLAELLRRHPHLHGTLVDLPNTAAAGKPVLDSAEFQDRYEICGQSFFDPLPAGGDVYLLANIVHDWADHEAIAILRRCAEAASPHGKVLLVDRVIRDNDDHLRVAAADLHMLLTLGGKERSEAEFAALGTAAGLRLDEVQPLTRPPDLFLVRYGVSLPGGVPMTTPESPPAR
ncbi:methyltransferase [Amycolatopsis suaedae]|uniref:Carminomycin 4-O-methyltransferase n=1 Tax=Amycolatopsis suaedae TaxID=2510978 RepID=A0A4Q7IX63_9PSEU|nr:methyltransferase [Amycolatopsis suaedae]RZQ59520.1 carminomycin 4-O-methyltransferase [Amycolatopsis suaedae]